MPVWGVTTDPSNPEKYKSVIKKVVKKSAPDKRVTYSTKLSPLPSTKADDCPKTPAQPNNGIVIACSTSEIAITSNPVLTNTASDCYFHCRYQWSAPAGWLIRRTDQFGGWLGSLNPFIYGGNEDMALIPPSGVTNGWVGNLTVTAIYAECGYYPNTSNSSPIWYGFPNLSSPLVNGSANQAYNIIPSGSATLSVSNNAVQNWSWTVDAGSGNIFPNGASCAVSFSGFLKVRVQATNLCGSSQAYFYYLNKTGSNGYKVFPNPSKDKVKVEFDFKEIAEDLLSEVKLLNEKGDVLRNLDIEKYQKDNIFKSVDFVELDVDKLPRGDYYLHLKLGDKTTKSKVVLE